MRYETICIDISLNCSNDSFRPSIHPSILLLSNSFHFSVDLSEPIVLSLWLSQATYRRDIWVTKQPCLNFNLAFQHASVTFLYNAVFTLPMCLNSVNKLPRNKEKPIYQPYIFYVVEPSCHVCHGNVSMLLLQPNYTYVQHYYSCLIPADVISVLFYLSVVSLS